MTDWLAHLWALAEQRGFAAQDDAQVAEMRGMVRAANQEIRWQPRAGEHGNPRPEELPLVSFPDARPVPDVPILLVPVTVAGDGPEHRLALFYIDDVSPAHPRFQRGLRPWGRLDDWRWRLQMRALGTALALVPKLRRALPVLSPSAADFFGVDAGQTRFQPGGTTGEARLLALLGLQRQPDPDLPALGRWLQRRIRAGMAAGGFGTVLRNRALAFVGQETRTLVELYERGLPITMLAIGPYDGRHHELAAIRGACERLGAGQQQRFLARVRIGFAEPDPVGRQIARAMATRHGIELFELPALDLADPARSGLEALVAAERALWRERAPGAGPAHVRAVFLGSAGEYRWGHIAALLRACRQAGVDSLHGSFMKETPFLRQAVALSRKDWLIHDSEQHILATLHAAGYQEDHVFSQARNPVVNVSARLAAPQPEGLRLVGDPYETRA